MLFRSLSDAPGTLNHPIDAFFASLAEEKREHSIAVVLSGTGSDGTNGVKAVKEHGGLVIAQDPDSAKFDGMPRSVISTGLADFILSPQEIAEEIGISGEDIVFALDAIQAPVSLQEPVYSDGGDALYVMDQISDKKNREEKWIEDLSLEAAMDHLSSREQYIIRLRFFEGKTQMEVAEEIQISQAQVSRLEKHALKVMRQYLNG